MNVLITGASGMIGSALTRYLASKGHTVKGLVRGDAATGQPFWNPSRGEIDFDGFPVEAVINLAGENVAQGRWTDDKKNRILKSRVDSTRLLAQYIANLENKPKVLISGSAVGFYGNCGANVIDESFPLGQGFLANVCKEWEAACQPAQEAGIRVAYLRTGMILSAGGGALKQMLLPFKLGLGGVIGSGRQYISWASIKDMVGMIEHIIDHPELQGPINMVSPEAVTNHQLTKALGRVLKRPTIMSLPAFMARLVFGSQMAEEMLLASANVKPIKIQESGYQFKFEDLEKSLRDLL